jgi:hypothetical protein
MTTPADELRTAASRLRQLADQATPAPWTWKRWHSDDCRTDCDDPTCFLLIVGSPHGPVGDADVDRDVFAVERSVQERGEGDAAYIAAMHPGVGLALADWLGSAAEDAEQIGADHRALTVARKILGGEQP